MSITFEFYKTPDSSEEKPDKYYARAVTLRTTKTIEIAESIHKSSSMTVGDVKSVLNALSEEIAWRLSRSERVYLEGIGYFQVSLKCDKEIDPKKTRAQNVWVKSVKFRPDQQLKNKLLYTKTVRSTIKRHSATLTNEEIDKKLVAFFEKESFLTRKRFEDLCDMTTSTATRHITRLKEEGKIKNMNTRMNPIYVLATPSL